jgi:tetratricopeptide (TPR) repeat protein
MGETHLAAGNYSSAAVSYQAALEISQRIGARYREGQALVGLGKAELSLAGAAIAARHWRDALEIFLSIGKARDADTSRALLNGLNDTWRDTGGHRNPDSACG